VIKVTRTAEPEVLARLGPGWVRAHVKDVQEEKAKLNFGEGVYGHDDVRWALRQMQHSKCCYCEVHMDEYTPRHVEHWRPKAAVKQDDDALELKPGYYWLAYKWDNLFLACTLCNSVHKRTLFPLRDPARRARSHLDSLLDEEPLLLRPDEDDPDHHIEWRHDQPRGLTDRGRATVEVVGLIRDNDSRRTELLKRLDLAHRRLLRIHGHPDFEDDAEEYREQLRTAKRTESPFSAMARAYLATLNIPEDWAI
jgi:uncharacterized protein (TIGR02646 family)